MDRWKALPRRGFGVPGVPPGQEPDSLSSTSTSFGRRQPGSLEGQSVPHLVELSGHLGEVPAVRDSLRTSRWMSEPSEAARPGSLSRAPPVPGSSAEGRSDSADPLG